MLVPLLYDHPFERSFPSTKYKYIIRDRHPVSTGLLAPGSPLSHIVSRTTLFSKEISATNSWLSLAQIGHQLPKLNEISEEYMQLSHKRQGCLFTLGPAYNKYRVLTRTGKPGKMGRHFPVREKSGNFEQTGKVREKSGKITQNTGKLR